MAVTDHGHARTPPVAPHASTTSCGGRAALNVATIGWNGIEGVVAVAAGVAAGSVSLVGFGFDSAIEVSAALILAWRLRRERRGGCMQADDHRATRAIAVSFAVLAAVRRRRVRPCAGVRLGARRQRDRHRDGQPLARAHAGAGARQAGAGTRPRLSRRGGRRQADEPLRAPLRGAAGRPQRQRRPRAGGGPTRSPAWPSPGIALAEARRTWLAESLEDTCCA